MSRAELPEGWVTAQPNFLTGGVSRDGIRISIVDLFPNEPADANNYLGILKCFMDILDGLKNDDPDYGMNMIAVATDMLAEFIQYEMDGRHEKDELW